MGILKSLLFNLLICFLACIAANLIGGVAIVIRNLATYDIGNVVTVAPRDVPILVEILLWLFVIASLAVFFFAGTKLTVTDINIINYLSVFWILPVALLIALYGGYLGAYIQAPFLNLMLFLNKLNISFYVTSIVLSLPPPILLLLGMLYQIRKGKTFGGKRTNE